MIEVGIGGEYDCTNIIRKPVVTGESDDWCEGNLTLVMLQV